MARKNHHVVPRAHGRWAVRQTGASRALKIFSDEAAAIAFGRDRARKDEGKLYIHRTDGSVRRRDSFSGDTPAPVASR